MKHTKLIVIGLDGAHFELIEPWLENGDLPHIKRCIEDGVSSDMEVCLPPVTSPNWKCYSTGKNPGKLGIFWWENIDLERRKVYYPHERKNMHKEIWDYLSDAGYKVCVIGTPLTYPPKKVNGVMISGGLDSAEEEITYPAELEKELKEKYGYRVHPEHGIQTDREKSAEEILELIELRFRVALDLIKRGKFDFVQITTFYINVLQHFLWDDDKTKRAWKIVDKYVGRLMEEKDVNLIFMSDHGSNKIDTAFNINTWLNKEGYLKYNYNYWVAKTISRLGFNKENLTKLADFLGLISVLKKIIPKTTLRKIPSKEMKKEAKTGIINWKKTDAIASGQGPVYLLNEDKKEEIKEKLRKLETPEGKKVLENVYEREEIYSGKYLAEAPSLIMDQAKNIHITGGLGKNRIFEIPEKCKWKAENKKYGLFVAYGPDFSGKQMDKISILDLAPTILKLYGLNKPKDMDGRVLRELLG